MAAVSLTAPIEALLNRHLQASTPARGILANLQGRSFALALQSGSGASLLRLRLEAHLDGCTVATGEAPADATVSGTPFGLAALLAGRAEGRYTSAGVTISGDAEVAASFEKLLNAARPDVEAELARLVGEVPAHYAARTAAGLFEWGRRAARSFARSSSEYLTEESRDLVPRAELEALLGGVDHIREDVDRAAARLDLLESRLRHKAS
ncbi:MAG: SCP2 sterol-binding domain-containing protein [Proteobacteria bacterium]|nr:SCP2 sterol-binding domain-containing protein [Pseudomonadota bacterium]